ncbi:hypothetical protein Dsin_006091 [Dipteronia sinensis]|uniref:RNA polymerase II C-terminal domain phosphatase-like n=1 Tax=Dipteronia sinensis TaxID=43782 RepID=A0AAE0AZ09_9ROSI|nr:hypothetical protein Dsin_006091 [Dipteronia sinensis]
MEEAINKPKDEVCRHARLVHGTCTNCGQFVDDWHGVAFDYVQEGLMLTRDEIARLKDTNIKKLFDEKKLQLVIDLDQTLLHSKSVEKLNLEEKYLENIQADSGGGGLFYKLETPERMVKLRPFVRNFLKEASTMFELYIYPMGSEFYGKRMAQLLDPQGNYFDNRVISKHDLIDKGKKTLDLVLGQESGIIILDDDETVWPDHKENLITIFPYSYFSEKRKRKSYSEMKKDESESYGALAFTIKVLRGIHGMFFNRNKSILPCNRDVRILMRILQSKVLKGCVIFFSGVDDDDECKECSDFVVKAKELGAECIDTLDSSSVTHVVSWTRTKTEGESDGWAKKEKKFLVNQRWI